MSETKFLSKDGLDLLVSNIKTYIQTYTADNGVIVKGDADNSAVLKGENNKVFSKANIALGQNNTAGLKGFYYKYITLNAGGNPNIANVYLSKTQVSNPTISTVSGASVKDTSIKPQTYFSSSEISNGIIVSIINDTKYDNVGKIKQAKDGLIQIEWINGTAPFNKLNTETNLSPEDYTIYCLEKPEAGISDIGQCSFVSGNSNISKNGLTTIFGQGNIAERKFAFLTGKTNRGGYNTVTFGEKNTNLANNSFVTGTNNINNGNNSTLHGNGHTNEGKRAFITGNTNITNNENESAFGQYNKSTVDKTFFSIGIGTSKNARKNSLEIHKSGKHYILGIGGYNGTNANDNNDIATIISKTLNTDNFKQHITTTAIGAVSLEEFNSLYDSIFGTTESINSQINNLTSILNAISSDISNLQNTKLNTEDFDSYKNTINESFENVESEIKLIKEDIADLNLHTEDIEIHITEEEQTINGIKIFEDDIQIKNLCGSSEYDSIKDNFLLTKGEGNYSIVLKENSNIAKSNYSFILGDKNTAENNTENNIKCSFIIGTNNISNEGFTTISGINNTAAGKFSRVSGINNQGGFNTTTFGENNENLTSNSFVSGTNNTNRGNNATVHGNYNVNNGKRAFIIGNFNITNNENESAFGQYNKSTVDKTFFSVGIGTSLINRKNALEITNDGKCYIYGLGGYNGTNASSDNDISSVLSGNSTVSVSSIYKTLYLTSEKTYVDTLYPAVISLEPNACTNYVLNGDGLLSEFTCNRVYFNFNFPGDGKYYHAFIKRNFSVMPNDYFEICTDDISSNYTIKILGSDNGSVYLNKSFSTIELDALLDESDNTLYVVINQYL